MALAFVCRFSPGRRSENRQPLEVGLGGGESQPLHNTISVLLPGPADLSGPASHFCIVGYVWVTCCLLRNCCWAWPGTFSTRLAFQNGAGAEHLGAATGPRAQLSGGPGTLQICPLAFEAQEGIRLLPPSEGLGALCFFIRPQFIHSCDRDIHEYPTWMLCRLKPDKERPKHLCRGCGTTDKSLGLRQT